MRFTCLLVGVALASPALSQGLGIKLANGTNGYVEMPYNAALIPPSGITVEAWVTYDSTTLQSGYAWPTVVRQNIAAGMETYFLRVDAAQTSVTSLRFKVVTTTGQYGASWSFAPGQLPWTHLAGTYDGSMVRLYVNGMLMGQSAASGRLLDNGGVLRIGKGDDATGGGEVWNGEIDEVRLWPFARSQNEIASTMNAALNAMPGGVSTWGLDGHYLDTSNGQHGTPMGTVTFTPNSLMLTPYGSPGAVAFGAGSAGCIGALASSVGSVAQVGNAAFSIVGTRGPSSGGGALMVGARRLTTAIKVLGIDVWVDPASPLVFVPVTSGPLGAASLPLGIPSSPSLQNGQLFSQFVWVDTCGPMGLTASDGLQLTILP